LANKDLPEGFKLAGKLLHAHRYAKSIAAAIYPGDLVKIDTDGLADAGTAGYVTNIGVALSYELLASTGVTVADDLDQLYYIQSDGETTTEAQSIVGNCVDILATVGSATWIRSKHEADIEGTGAGTKQLLILGKHPADAWSSHARLLVKIVESIHAGTIGGHGI
jgi:hypothetical protein